MRPPELSRRQALTGLGGLGLAAVLAACSSSKDAAAPGSPSTAGAPGNGAGSSTTSGSTRGAGGTPASAASIAAADFEAASSCTATVEQTEGPYYLDVDLIRADITEGRPGRPMDLGIRVLDADGCTPIADAMVEVWHCDAVGVYSGFEAASNEANGLGAGGPGRGRPGGPLGGGAPPSGAGGGDVGGPADVVPSGNPDVLTPVGLDGQVRYPVSFTQGPTGGGKGDGTTYLRGGQPTSGEGVAAFRTIYPGWYTGRTVHIHVKVLLSDREVLTSQLYFDDGFSDRIYATAPYSDHAGPRATTNANDGIAGGPDAPMLTLTEQGDVVRGLISITVAR